MIASATETTITPPGRPTVAPATGSVQPNIDAVIAALSDSTRRAALRLARDAEMSAGELARAFPTISRPAVSQHLKVLVEAGLMSVRRQGNRRLYRSRTEALSPVSAFIDDMWSNRLQDLQRVAEARTRRTRGGR